MEIGPELFGQETTIHEYEKKVSDLEQLIGHKEVKIALFKKLLGRSLTREKKVDLVRGHKHAYSLNRVLKALRLSKRIWYYAQRKQSYEEKYHHLRKPLEKIARVHPEYEYRRMTAELGERGFHINRKCMSSSIYH